MGDRDDSRRRRWRGDDLVAEQLSARYRAPGSDVETLTLGAPREANRVVSPLPLFPGIRNTEYALPLGVTLEQTMRANTISRLASLVAAGVLATSCSDSSTGPDKTPPVDLTEALAEANTLVAGTTALIPLPMPSLSTAPVPSSCSYVASSQSFVCAPITRSGVTFSSSYKLFTATNTPQSQFDAATTAAVESIFDASGTIGTGAAATSMTEHQDMTLSGLLTGPHVLNGVSTLHLTGTGPIPTDALDLLVTTTTAGLTLPNRNAGSQWPTAGTITSVFTDKSFSSMPFTSTIAMKFNGTSTVALTLTSDGVSKSCSMDLTSTQFPACFSTLFTP
jgi:hypothetical protein